MPVLTLVTEQCLAPVPGGTGRYTREVGRSLAVMTPPDWQVQGVVGWHRDVRAARISGVAGPRRLPAPRRALTALWERGLPPLVGGDVVHATTPLAPMAPRLRTGALVVTIHDAVPYTHPDLLTPRGVAWHRRMIGLAARAADAVVVPTLAVATELARHVDLRRVEVIGEGVAQAFAAPPPARAVAAVTTRLGLPERYLVAVGTLEPRKGLPTIIRALDQLPPDVHLAVVGPAGWGDATPEASDRVHLLGRLTDADLAAVVAGAAVSVHASRSEGFGLPLVEAMSVGTPVVHSAIDVFAEVAQLAGASFPVDDDRALADAVRPFLADDSKARTATASAGRAVAATHSWTNVAERLWDLYRELAADR
ncbi:MAG: hypothetical protein BGO96_03865 [Micrococcales bacterium 73-15]|uniref:glycosyltransferase n=1 Tax=Salana multivorans TaxID=120377 RepID=UPI0009672D0C|nr:glycosyltransferase [Salana multivorans]OJX98329.1 MAG: hypothetical protein BGO96_03865 [Micrococcales bacterium 73-15]